MPIRPERRNLYPNNWAEISMAIRRRAEGKCEQCGSFNGLAHPITSAKVVLTVAHMDHDETNCDEGNLKALCQRCHNGHDAPVRAWNRKYKVDEGQMKMGEGI